MRPFGIWLALGLGWMLALSASAQFAGRKVVLDAGHGGSDPGALGIDGSAIPNEEDFVLDTTLRLRSLLESAGATVLMTRTTDTTVSLTARRDLTNNEDPDAFLSIHCNSFSDSSANGTETFWWNSGNTADQSLATKVQAKMQGTFGLTNRGVKQAGFTVLTSDPPAALAEMMFISNLAEFNLMNQAATRQNAAQAFYEALAEFLGIALTSITITQHPATLTISAGQTATFAVSASGGPLSYQWQKNGVNLANGGRVSGATSSTLQITNAALTDAAFYTCRVSNATDAEFSNAGQLVIATTPIPIGTGTGLRGTYYDHPNFTALRRARVDSTVDFAWGTGSPSSTMESDSFSVRWTGRVEPRYTQPYTFSVRSDEGVRLWVNGVLLIDRFVTQATTEWSGSIALTAGQKADIILEYFEATGSAGCELRWSSASQIREIIPATQLSRPAPILAAQGPVQILAGQAWTLPIQTQSIDPWLSSQPWADFAGETLGTADSVLFRRPSVSGTTGGNLEAAQSTTVVANPRATNVNDLALRVQWAFLPSAPQPWLRLTTFNAATLGNPVVNFQRTLLFDVWSAQPLRLGLGLRETNTPSTAAIGDNGGSAGTIEFAGVSDVISGRPSPVLNVPANAWTTAAIDIPAAPVRPFTGDGLLTATASLGVLEHLAIVPGAGAGLAHDVYLDNFVSAEPNRIAWSLLSAPTGAAIDPITGSVGWTPTQPGSYNFTVAATDAGTPATMGTQNFAVLVVPSVEIRRISHEGQTLQIEWQAIAGARYQVETSTTLLGPWTVAATLTASSATPQWSTVTNGPREFYRIHWIGL
jgi:N-acetylmuramoyl-L-alanine amidase